MDTSFHKEDGNGDKPHLDRCGFLFECWVDKKEVVPFGKTPNHPLNGNRMNEKGKFQ